VQNIGRIAGGADAEVMLGKKTLENGVLGNARELARRLDRPRKGNDRIEIGVSSWRTNGKALVSPVSCRPVLHFLFSFIAGLRIPPAM